MNNTLLQLSQHYLEVESEIEQNDGILTEELEKKFDSICFDLMAKMENYLSVIDNTESKIELGKKIILRVQKNVKVLEKQHNRLNQNLIIHMQNIDKEIIETELGKIRLQYSESIKNYPITEYPAGFIKTKIIEEVDKSGLKKFCKDNPDMAEKFIEKKPFIKIY